MRTVYDLTREQLTDRLLAWGQPAFRATQVWMQLWRRAATYDRMSEISPALRQRLAAELPIGIELIDERTADSGATRKALLKLGGEHLIEVVLMGYPDRVTVSDRHPWASESPMTINLGRGRGAGGISSTPSGVRAVLQR